MSSYILPIYQVSFSHLFRKFYRSCAQKYSSIYYMWLKKTKGYNSAKNDKITKPQQDAPGPKLTIVLKSLQKCRSSPQKELFLPAYPQTMQSNNRAFCWKTWFKMWFWLSDLTSKYKANKTFVSGTFTQLTVHFVKFPFQ